MNYTTYSMYRDQAINAGYLPKHVDTLTLPQLKKLVTTYDPGFDLPTVLNKSNYATLKKFATTNYGLNPDVASKLGIERLKEYIQTESLYKQEGIVQNRLAEGPYYPGPLAAAQLNTPQLTYNEPSLYAPSIMYNSPAPLYLPASPQLSLPAPSLYSSPSYQEPSLYQPNYQTRVYQPPFLTESVTRGINRALGNPEGSSIQMIGQAPDPTLAPSAPPLTPPLSPSPAMDIPASSSPPLTPLIPSPPIDFPYSYRIIN